MKKKTSRNLFCIDLIQSDSKLKNYEFKEIKKLEESNQGKKKRKLKNQNLGYILNVKLKTFDFSFFFRSVNNTISLQNNGYKNY